MTTDHQEAAHATNEYPDAEPPPRRRFIWPTTPQAAGEWVANATVLFLIVGAIAIAIAAVWP